jgi:hypothetical protein
MCNPYKNMCSMCILQDGIRGESFVVGQFIVIVVICEVICVVNTIFKRMISWPIGERMQNVMASLKARCGLLSV